MKFGDTFGLFPDFPDDPQLCMPDFSKRNPYKACVEGCQRQFDYAENKRADWYLNATTDCENDDVFNDKRKKTACMSAVMLANLQKQFFNLRRRDECLERCAALL